jgi:four helix bundle protein
MSRGAIKNHKDLEVYKKAFEVAMQIFELSKKFPVEERYSLTDQIRRSSRSVCANLAEVAAPLGSFLKSCRVAQREKTAI